MSSTGDMRSVISWLHVLFFLCTTLCRLLPTILIVPSILWENFLQRHHQTTTTLHELLDSYSSAATSLLPWSLIIVDMYAWSLAWVEAQVDR